MSSCSDSCGPRDCSGSTWPAAALGDPAPPGDGNPSVPGPDLGPAGRESADGTVEVARLTSLRLDAADIGFLAPSAVSAKPVMAAAEAVLAEREVEYGFEAGAIGEVLAPVRPTALLRELPALAAAPLLSALSVVLFFDEAAVFDEARAWAEACR